MNKNATPIILIVISLGIYFTFTTDKIEELKAIQSVNEKYKEAIEQSKTLIKERDEALATYNSISDQNKQRLDKIIPDNQDNVRLIIDLNGVAARHGIALKNIRTASPKDTASPSSSNTPRSIVLPGTYNTVTFSFDTSTSYANFLSFMRDIQLSLRIMEISKISLKANDTGNYDFSVDIKTFWLKE